MRLNLPGTSGLGDDLMAPRSAGLDDVDWATVQQWLDSMHRGQTEFIGLQGNDTDFIQAAGQGDGPYQMERWIDGNVVAQRFDARFADVVSAFASYMGFS